MRFTTVLGLITAFALINTLSEHAGAQTESEAALPSSHSNLSTRLDRALRESSDQSGTQNRKEEAAGGVSRELSSSKETALQNSSEADVQLSKDSIRTIDGEIVEMRTISLKHPRTGEELPHVLAMVRTSGGRQQERDILVDLGPRKDLRERGISIIAGDQIKVSGAASRFNERPILVAIMFSSGGQAVLTEAHSKFSSAVRRSGANLPGQEEPLKPGDELTSKPDEQARARFKVDAKEREKQAGYK
ncbi:MAG: hypothetical protein J5J00_00980 [Deltaproteobacteria bacterium]|nr:hypothetical protein [Deltaproteobacteria bacterium]